MGHCVNVGMPPVISLVLRIRWLVPWERLKPLPRLQGGYAPLADGSLETSRSDTVSPSS